MTKQSFREVLEEIRDELFTSELASPSEEEIMEKFKQNGLSVGIEDFKVIMIWFYDTSSVIDSVLNDTNRDIDALRNSIKIQGEDNGKD